MPDYGWEILFPEGLATFELILFTPRNTKHTLNLHLAYSKMK